MLKPSDLAVTMPGLAGDDEELERFLGQSYDHASQTRTIGRDGMAGAIYPTSTRFDGDPT